MTFSKIAAAFTATSLLVVAPAFAQNAATTSGTASGTGTASQPMTGSPMKGSNTMMKSGNGTMMKSGNGTLQPAPTTESKPTATGGPSGGLPNKSN